MAPQPQDTSPPVENPSTISTATSPTDTASVVTDSATEILIPFTAPTQATYTLHVPLSASGNATAVLQGPGGSASAPYTIPSSSQPIVTPTPVSFVTLTSSNDTYVLALPTDGSLNANVEHAGQNQSFRLDQVAGSQPSGAPVGALAALGAIAGLGLLAAGTFAFLFFRRRGATRPQQTPTKLYTPAESNTHYANKLQADNAALQQRVQTLEKDNLRFAAQSPSTLNDVSTFSSTISVLNGALEQVYGHGGPAVGKTLAACLYRDVFSRLLVGIDDTTLLNIYRNMPDPTSALTWRAQTASFYYSSLSEQDLQATKTRLVKTASSEIAAVSNRGSASLDKYINRAVDLAIHAGKAVAMEAGAYDVLYAPAGAAYDPATMAALDGFSVIGGTRAFGLRFGGHVALKIKASP